MSMQRLKEPPGQSCGDGEGGFGWGIGWGVGVGSGVGWGAGCGVGWGGGVGGVGGAGPRPTTVPDITIVEMTSWPTSKYELEQISPEASPPSKVQIEENVFIHSTLSSSLMPLYGATNAVKVGYDMNADHQPSPVFGTLSQVTKSLPKAVWIW